MAFKDTPLGQVREKLGHGTLLWPGVSILVEDSAGRLLLMSRSDGLPWSLPGGAAQGESFLDAARRELREETGLEASLLQTKAFGCVSEERFKVVYPNGDITHFYVMLFAVQYSDCAGRLRADGEESLEVKFFNRDALPDTHPQTQQAIELHRRYRTTGQFQAF